MGDYGIDWSKGEDGLTEEDFETIFIETSKIISEKTETAEEIAEAYYSRGLVYKIREDYQKAIDDYTFSINLNYSYLFAAYFNRARAFESLRKYSEAINDYKKCLESEPKLKSMKEEAEERIEYLIYYTETQYGVDWSKDFYSFTAEDYHIIIREATNIIDSKTDDLEACSKAHYYRGLAHNRLGQYLLGIIDLTMAIRYNFHDPYSAYCILGFSYYKHGKPIKALEYFNKAYEIDPERENAKTWRKIITDENIGYNSILPS